MNLNSSFRRYSSVTAICIVILLGFVIAIPAFSYLPMYTRSTSGTPQPDHWNFTAFPVTWSLNTNIGSNVDNPTAAVSVIQASFNTWLSAPNTAIQVSRGSDSTKTSSGFDGVNLICFVCTGDFSKDSTTLAVTITTTADAPGQDTKHGGTASFAGQILDADLLFSPSVQWTTTGTPTGSQQDLQTVATHELGHFFGLDHSAVVRSLMFPFAPEALSTLSYDDVAGISSIYPKSSADVPTGTITGTVKFSGGSGVFGAHVFAESTSSNLGYPGSIRKSPIGALTVSDGTYTIKGLPPDSYTVAAEPLDDPVTNGDVEGYASAMARSSVQTNFKTRWH